MNISLRIIFVSSILLALTVNLNAQVVDAPKLKEIKGKKLLEQVTPLKHKKGLWGYANDEGKYVIKPVFTEACPFEGNLARVNVDGKWGTISSNGLFIVEPIYESIAEYSADSLAVVSLFSKYGLINAKGQHVQTNCYEEIQYADYGYRGIQNGKYNTIDSKGAEILPPQFDDMVMLDRRRGLEQVLKDGQWGVLQNGRDILADGFDDKLVLLQSGAAGQPDLYTVHQGGKMGIVTSYGQFVVPCVYDDIVPSLSGQYYLTTQDGKYGAISLKMTELIAPILDKRPYLGEDIFTVHDNGSFYAVNSRGSVPFEDCADLYYMFKPDEYANTTSIPAWSKNAIIEENLLARQKELENASLLNHIMEKSEYDPDKAKAFDTLPSDLALFIPASEKEKYGIAEGGHFVGTSGTVTDYEEGYHNLHYTSQTPSGVNVRVVSVPSTGEYLVAADRDMISLNKTLTKFNVKSFAGIYPKDYALLPDDRLVIRFAFIRNASEVSESIVEDNPYYLPVPSFPVTLHKGAANPSLETQAIITFSLDSLAAINFAQLPQSVEGRMSASIFGGFYTHSSGTILVDEKTPLRKYNRNGVLDWEYRPRNGEAFYDFDETENYIYLSGSTKNSSFSGIEVPFIVQLSKTGIKERELLKEYQNARFTGLVCHEYLIYAKTAFLKNKEIGSDYYPHFVLENLGDNFGVRHRCAWEPWGDASVGGCGLISHKGKWLYAPSLKPDQMCTAYDWEFGGFMGDHLIVRHLGKYGLIDKAGEMVIQPEYDYLEILENQDYVKVGKDDSYGVLDVTGKIVLPVEYDYIGKMSEDLIVAKRGSVYGCFDKTGTLVVPMEYDEIREFVGGMARIRIYGKLGFINASGDVVVAPFSDEVENFSEGCCLVTMRNKVGLVNLQGDWIAAPMYEDGGSFSAGYAYLAQKGKYGYIDKSGEFVIPMKYSKAKSFNPINKLACVAEGDKWGVIDLKGHYVVPPEYNNVTLSIDGYICVEKDGKSGIFTSEGRMLYPVECDKIDCDENTMLFRHGVANARLDGQRIRIDNHGNVIYQYSLLTDE